MNVKKISVCFYYIAIKDRKNKFIYIYIYIKWRGITFARCYNCELYP